MPIYHLSNKNWLKYLLLVLVLSVFIPAANGQSSPLTIDQCYRLARKNYPLIKQKDLITKTKDYSVSNASKGYLPAFSVNGQATYQSAVSTLPFTIPIKGFSLPAYSKDQYKIYGELDQTIYDGGVIKNQKQTAEANEIIQQQSLEVELYALYERVNQLFFGALLIDEQLKQNDLLKADVQNGIDKTKALVTNGIAYRSSVDELQAQLLQTDQSRIELISSKKAYTDMLSLFINSPVDENTVLEKPAAPVLTDSISRPELLSYDYQKKTNDLQYDLLKAQIKPKLGLFVQGGYARPGLDFLDNNFAWYYIGGLKLSWNLGSLYTLKNQKRILEISKETLDIQKETFVFNTNLTQKQQNSDINKYLELVKTDDEIIQMRESVKNAASAQLANGVLSAHDYATEVNAEDEARQNKILHEMQLLQTQYSYQNTIGNIKPSN
jgi:outer membrane protein TolC